MTDLGSWDLGSRICAVSHSRVRPRSPSPERSGPMLPPFPPIRWQAVHPLVWNNSLPAWIPAAGGEVAGAVAGDGAVDTAGGAEGAAVSRPSGLLTAPATVRAMKPPSTITQDATAMGRRAGLRSGLTSTNGSRM